MDRIYKNFHYFKFSVQGESLALKNHKQSILDIHSYQFCIQDSRGFTLKLAHRMHIYIYDALSYLSTDACRRNLISTNFFSYRFVTNHKKSFHSLLML